MLFKTQDQSQMLLKKNEISNINYKSYIKRPYIKKRVIFEILLFSNN